MTSPFAFEWLFAHAQKTPGAPFVGTPSGWATYADIAERTTAFARRRSDAGLRAGERVMVGLPNLPATVIASLAIQSVGGCAVEVNREWGEAALASIAEQIDARFAVIFGRDAALWGGLSAKR